MKADVMAPLALLRPTQITVGLFQVQAKMQMTERLNASERARLMAKHPVQVVIGPGFERYIIDHHHWARAWYELELRETPVVVVDDFSRMSPTEFWKRMERERRIHPYDESGAKCALSALPATVFELRDDPYQSLAAFVRKAGGYKKPSRAYSDFRWVDFFRARIQGDFSTPGGFAHALLKGVKIARGPEAKGMPGYIGHR
jgi:hypothetical protein